MMLAPAWSGHDRRQIPRHHRTWCPGAWRDYPDETKAGPALNQRRNRSLCNKQQIRDSPPAPHRNRQALIRVFVLVGKFRRRSDWRQIRGGWIQPRHDVQQNYLRSSEDHQEFVSCLTFGGSFGLITVCDQEPTLSRSPTVIKKKITVRHQIRSEPCKTQW